MYLDVISQNREWKVSDFRDTVSVGLKAHVTLAQARKAKKKALALIDGCERTIFHPSGILL